MPRLVVSPIALYPMRPGAAIMAWKPKVHLYAGAFGMVTLNDPTTGAPLRNWSLCRVQSWTDQAGAEADPDLFFFPDGLSLEGAQETLYREWAEVHQGASVETVMTDTPVLVRHRRGTMRVYVASSWRNTFQPGVVRSLRADGHEVYDFKDEDGFHWTEVDGGWQDWPNDISKYLAGLKHPCAERGFYRDMTALKNCDVCVYVMPCGVSASLEAGWAVGAGKPVYVYVPGLREPDLMVKMATLVTMNINDIRAAIRSLRVMQEVD